MKESLNIAFLTYNFLALLIKKQKTWIFWYYLDLIESVSHLKKYNIVNHFLIQVAVIPTNKVTQYYYIKTLQAIHLTNYQKGEYNDFVTKRN